MRARLPLLLVASIGCRGDATPPRPQNPASASAPPACATRSSDLRAGDRVGTHGMVVFGRPGGYFLEHLPMYTPPHDEQIVMRVSLRTAAGAALDVDLSDQAYSIKPTAELSLDDLLLRSRTSFPGDLHRGNFEADGPVIHPGVTVTVDEILLSIRVPADGHTSPSYYVVGNAAGGMYATNAIRDSRGILEIIRLASFPRPPPAGCALALTEAEARELVGAAGSTRLWCLRPPDFVEPCER